MKLKLVLWEDKTDKPLARFIKKKRERAQINKIRNEKGEVTAHATEIQRIMKDYYKQLYANKMDRFLERHNLTWLNQEEVENNEQTNHKYWNWNCDLKTPKKQKSRTRWLHSQLLSTI